MTSFPGQPDHPQARPTPRCAWPPERAAYVTCQRCGRAVCPECQRPAAVGVQCPECSAQGSAFTEAQQAAARNAQRRNTPWVIYSIIALCVLAYLAQLAIPGFTDRIYDAAGSVSIMDADKTVTLRSNAASTILWNPGPEGAHSLTGWAADEWRSMVCVEMGNVQHRAVTVEAGGSHTLTLEISSVSHP